LLLVVLLRVDNTLLIVSTLVRRVAESDKVVGGRRFTVEASLSCVSFTAGCSVLRSWPVEFLKLEKMSLRLK
jgi:hypothetical protein